MALGWLDRPRTVRHWARPPGTRKMVGAEGEYFSRRRTGQPRLDGIKLHERRRVYRRSTIWLGIGRLAPTPSERLGYPTQKPSTFFAVLLQHPVRQVALVLDCFMGSGTTSRGRRAARSPMDRDRYGSTHFTSHGNALSNSMPTYARRKYRPSITSRCRNARRIFSARRNRRRALGPSTCALSPSKTWASTSGRTIGRVSSSAPLPRRNDPGFRWRSQALTRRSCTVLKAIPGSMWARSTPPVSAGPSLDHRPRGAATETKVVTVLSADFDTLSRAKRRTMKKKTGVRSRSASSPRGDRRSEPPSRPLRDDPHRADGVDRDPGVLRASLHRPGEPCLGRSVELKLNRCEVDIESFICQPAPTAQAGHREDVGLGQDEGPGRKQAVGEARNGAERVAREGRSWQTFVDFWAVDWDYGRHLGERREAHLHDRVAEFCACASQG